MSSAVKTVASVNDESRTTPIGMARYAREFFEAALAVDDKMGQNSLHAPTPALYLMGHSIELSLKAFLLNHEVPLRQLRSKTFGHDLHASIRKAKELGLESLVKLGTAEAGSLELLNDLYSTKQLEYIVSGYKSYPIFGLVETTAARLFNAICRDVGYNKQIQGYGYDSTTFEPRETALEAQHET